MLKVGIVVLDLDRQKDAEWLSAQLNIPIVTLENNSENALLAFVDQHLELRAPTNFRFKPIYVDFLQGRYNQRQQQIGKNSLLAKAVGFDRKKTLKICDATAGLGMDSFLLASLGCEMTMCERSPIVNALLQDGLRRAQQETGFKQLALQLINTDAMQYLQTLSIEHYPDVIYLDPMYPDTNRTALSKKEMQLLREVVGEDLDAEYVFNAALKYAKKRVVVKRARLAPTINQQKPDLVLAGSSSRFDIYFPSSL